MPQQTIKEYVNNIIKSCFEEHSVTAQAQILYGLIKHKKIKPATKLLGFQYAKSKKTCETIKENTSEALSTFSRSRNTYV